jgi:hypothetical protein
LRLIAELGQRMVLDAPEVHAGTPA